MEMLVACRLCGTQILKEDVNKHEMSCSKGCKQRSSSIVGSCKHCGRVYKRMKALNDHEIKCKKMPKTSHIPKRKKRRKSIDPCLRKKVWDTYIGQKTSGVCFCCWKNEITPFTYCNTIQAGHIQSHAHGGADTIHNLLPICRDCNMNMDAEDWDDYVARHPHLPLRVYGANPPKKIIWATMIIQSLVRMWLERKNPDSAWRQRWRALKNSK